MRPDKTFNLLHSKGNSKKNDKATRMGKNICKHCDQQMINF